MNVLLVFLLGAIPAYSIAQDVMPPVKVRDIQLVKPKISHDLLPIHAPGWTVDSVFRQETDTSRRSLAKPAPPQLIVDGYEYFGLRLTELDPDNIKRMEIRKDGEYKERGVVFIYTKRRLRPNNVISLSKYLQRQFKNYKKSEEARYIINGLEVKNYQKALLSEADVVSVSRTIEKSPDRQPAVIYEIGFQTVKTGEESPAARRPAGKDHGIRIRGIAFNQTDSAKEL